MLHQFEELQKIAQEEWNALNTLKRPRILIGTATCGQTAGALRVEAAFNKKLAARSLDADIYTVGCLGLCYAEPLVEIGLPDGRRVMYGNVTEKMAARLIKHVIKENNPLPELALATVGEIPVDGIPALSELPMLQNQVRLALRNTGVIDPTNIYHYIAREGYSGLAKALEMPPEAIIGEIKRSELRGRGGPGFLIGTEWEFMRKAQSTRKYVLCNADEGDPGLLASRIILESDPHAVLEGLAIAAYAIGVKTAYIYVRGEYALAIERLENAIAQMHVLGLSGKNILGSDFSLDIKIKREAGVFIRGEETALNASLEGYWGMPKPKPSFPIIPGIDGDPTTVNNVETMAVVSGILNKGAKWFSQYGTERNRGTKTFTLAGDLNHTGMIEIPMGTTLQDIVYTIGGGIPDGKTLKAVQIGGASGGSLPAERIGLEIDYDNFANAGAIMGSGGIIVLNEDSCMVDIAKYFLEFACRESCGTCAFCQIGSTGSQQMLRLLTEITEGKASAKHLEIIENLAQTIKTKRLCGLGQILPNPVLSGLRYFRDEFEEHVREKRCRAAVCKGLAPSPVQAAELPVNLRQRIGWALSDLLHKRHVRRQQEERLHTPPVVKYPEPFATKEILTSKNTNMAADIANKILVIDDEQIVGESLRRTFQDEGYELETADSGQEGLRKACKGKYDLMIVDLKMPDINGLDVLRWIKTEQPDTKMIMITGYPTADSKAEALKIGAFDYIPKPFTPEEISSVVGKALETRR